MTNSLNVVAKTFSDILIFLLHVHRKNMPI